MASDEPVDSRFQHLLEDFEQYIREQADLERLKVIRRQIRKTLPLSVRAYLPAYLLQEAIGAGVPRAATRPRPVAATKGPPAAPKAAPPRAPATDKRSNDKRPPAPPAEQQAADGSDKAPPVEGEMARLFVSVGRSRRVSRQGLTDLFVAKLDLKQEDVGEVRILDNYSFIELPATVAESAIEKISGETLNGRRLNVDYARNKKS